MILKIAICCPASLPATQFGGILFLSTDLAREFSEKNDDAIIYTTDLDFANNIPILLFVGNTSNLKTSSINLFFNLSS